MLALIWGCKWKQEAKTFVHLTHNQPHRKTKQLSQLRDLPGLSASPLLSAGSGPHSDSTLCLLAQHQAFYPPALFRCCGIAVDVAQRLGCGALHAWGSQQGVRQLEHCCHSREMTGAQLCCKNKSDYMLELSWMQLLSCRACSLELSACSEPCCNLQEKMPSRTQ